MRSGQAIQKRVQTGYLFLSFLLIAYVIWRSISISFTHDESLSYTIITGNETQVYTANNHWLNTVLMFVFSKIFGYSEFALRFPNVIAFAIYLLLVYRIWKKFSGATLSLVIAAPLLLLNPFMLDFFGLARGYGLGMMFFTASIYYLLLYFLEKQTVKYITFFVVSSACCVYSNYAFLTAILALHGAVLICYFKVHRVKLWQLATFYAVEAILLIPAVLNILYLSEKKELYAGGDNNVFQDTLKSIVSFSLSYGEDPYHFTQIALVLLAAVFVCALFFLRSRSLKFILISLLLLLAIPTLLHFFLGMGFPKDRAALYWMIVIGFMVLFSAPLKKKYVAIFAFSALALMQVVNFVPNCNLRHTIIWKYDSDVKNALELINKERFNGEISIGCNWLLEPALNYYRETRNLKWLKPVTREGVGSKYDQYLIFMEDLPALKDRNMAKIKYYPKSELFVMKEAE